MIFFRKPLSLFGMAIAPAILLLLTLSGATHAQERMSAATIEKIQADLDQYVEKSRKAWGVPGVAVGIVAEDKLVYARGFGEREVGKKAPVDPDTAFQIGSSSKAFLATTEAILFDRGKLSSQDRVIDHLPEFRLYDPWVTREFRIGDLLCQRSGLPGWASTNLVIYGYSEAHAIQSLRDIKPVSSFRSVFAYQNIFHLVAGKIQSRLFGVSSWEQALQKEIFDPLKMTSSGYTVEGLKAKGNFAKGHHVGPEGAKVEAEGKFPYNAGGAGAITSTVRDMSHWLRFQINAGEFEGQRLLSKERLQETHQPRIVIDEDLYKMTALDPEDMITYASAWFVHTLPYARVIEHGGATTSYNSFVAFDPDRKFGVVVLTNAMGEGERGPATPLGKYILDRLYDRPVVDHVAEDLAKLTQETPPARLTPSRPLEQYVGEYASPALGTVSIQPDKNGELGFVLGPVRLPVVLKHVSGDVFQAIVTNPAARSGEYNLVGQPVPVHFRANSNDEIATIQWGLKDSFEFTEFSKLEKP